MCSNRARRLNRLWHLLKRAKKQNDRRQRLRSARQLPPPTYRKVKVTRRQRRKAYSPSAAKITFPAKFDLIENSSETISFFDRLREIILIHPSKTVEIEHRSIEQVSPEAGIVLIAELFRADSYAPKCSKHGTVPTSQIVAELFEKIGYWKYFGLRYRGKAKSKRQFMIHSTGNRINGKTLYDMLVHFEEAVEFSPSEKSQLYVSLIECLDNVMNHAYPYRRKYDPPRLRHQWWMLAYRDSETHEVYVCVYDQGVGIPATIRREPDRQLELIKQSDGDLIIKGVIEGSFSRSKRRSRGTGLPSLRQFIEEANDGELTIISDTVHCVFRHNEVPKQFPLASPFQGTLITWRICR